MIKKIITYVLFFEVLMLPLECLAGELLDAYKVYNKINPSMNSRSLDESRKEITEITKIGIERVGCFGPCPVYTATIDSNGKIFYVGKRYVEKIGTHYGQASLLDLNRVKHFIDAINFMEFDMLYSDSVTDNPAVITMVKKNGQMKLVYNYANVGPPELWAFEQLIDKLLIEAKWDDAEK